MAGKTSVVGNRVTIGDFYYDVTLASAGRYSVADEFGERLGYFTIRGRAIAAEDFGNSPVKLVEIGRAWLAAQAPPKPTVEPESKVVCRVATYDAPAAADLAKMKAYQAWLKKQRGVRASYFAHDPASGKTMSVTVWESPDHLAALKDHPPPEGASELPATTVELLPVVPE